MGMPRHLRSLQQKGVHQEAGHIACRSQSWMCRQPMQASFLLCIFVFIILTLVHLQKILFTSHLRCNSMPKQSTMGSRNAC